MKRLLMVLLAVAFSAAAMAQAYKWTDKSGRVQYGDVPAADATNVTRLKGAPSGYATAPAAPEAKKDAGKDKDKDKALTPEQAFKKRQQERAEAEQKADKERAETDQKRANCEAAQASLRQLESGQRVATVNAAGERVFIDEEQRSREIQRAQASVSSWCK